MLKNPREVSVNTLSLVKLQIWELLGWTLTSTMASVLEAMLSAEVLMGQP